jgi:hypothetical protein
MSSHAALGPYSERRKNSRFLDSPLRRILRAHGELLALYNWPMGQRLGGCDGRHIRSLVLGREYRCGEMLDVHDFSSLGRPKRWKKKRTGIRYTMSWHVRAYCTIPPLCVKANDWLRRSRLFGHLWKDDSRARSDGRSHERVVAVQKYLKGLFVPFTHSQYP